LLVKKSVKPSKFIGIYVAGMFWSGTGIIKKLSKGGNKMRNLITSLLILLLTAGLSFSQDMMQQKEG
jgi:hypothetical protein